MRRKFNTSKVPLKSESRTNSRISLSRDQSELSNESIRWNLSGVNFDFLPYAHYARGKPYELGRMTDANLFIYLLQMLRSSD